MTNGVYCYKYIDKEVEQEKHVSMSPDPFLSVAFGKGSD